MGANEGLLNLPSYQNELELSKNASLGMPLFDNEFEDYKDNVSQYLHQPQ